MPGDYLKAGKIAMDKRQRIAISEFVSDRTPRPLTGPLLTFDLPSEVAQLHAEPIWHTHGHNARTLLKQRDLRVVLVVLREGKHVQEHEASEPLAIQPLRGAMRVHVPTEIVELTANQLLSIDKRVPYGIEATEDCELLLWVGWSKD
jgi:mannose-6-phosphate isomerase-like protein (cupin superfamily)